jgi:murein DD-endopeptidase MepM/ murein hydrolase activator NlpD
MAGLSGPGPHALSGDLLIEFDRGTATPMRRRAKRRWTLMLVSHGSGRSRAVQVSHTVAKGVIGIAGTTGFVLVVLGVAALLRGLNVVRFRALRHEHRVLVEEIQRTNERLLALRDSLDTLNRSGQQLRLLAGLEPLDSAVEEGGIGGPPGAWPERDSLEALGAEGAHALAARVQVDQLTRRANILASAVARAYDSLASHEARFAATPSILPADGRISSPFSLHRFDPVVHIVRPHQGIDVAAPMGSEIEAPAAGIVVDVKWQAGYGNILTIDHGYGVVTRYAHCSKILVSRGQRVKRGQKIALVGSTGESTGPHVHYEVWVNGKPVNPKQFVLPEDAITD